MKRLQVIFSTLAVAAMMFAGATSISALIQTIPPPTCDPEQGDCSKWGMVCCGPNCVYGEEHTDYCLYEGPYDCCK